MYHYVKLRPYSLQIVPEQQAPDHEQSAESVNQSGAEENQGM